MTQICMLDHVGSCWQVTLRGAEDDEKGWSASALGFASAVPWVLALLSVEESQPHAPEFERRISLLQ